MRRFVGHDRYSGQVAGQTMAHLYGALRLYVNFFQSSFTLIDKTRDGSTTIKCYSPPTAPCGRLIQPDATGDDMRNALIQNRAMCRCCILSEKSSRPWCQRLYWR